MNKNIFSHPSVLKTASQNCCLAAQLLELHLRNQTQRRKAYYLFSKKNFKQEKLLKRKSKTYFGLVLQFGRAWWTGTPEGCKNIISICFLELRHSLGGARVQK